MASRRGSVESAQACRPRLVRRCDLRRHGRSCLHRPRLDRVRDPQQGRLRSAVNWFLPDLHGNIAASLSADESTVANATRYDPYGEILATSQVSPVAPGTWTFQGRLDLSPAGVEPLLDGGARNYAPSVGTFTSLDTVMGSAQNPLSLHRFLYAEANPTTMIDPSGHCTR